MRPRQWRTTSPAQPSTRRKASRPKSGTRRGYTRTLDLLTDSARATGEEYREPEIMRPTEKTPSGEIGVAMRLAEEWSQLGGTECEQGTRTRRTPTMELPLPVGPRGQLLSKTREGNADAGVETMAERRVR